LEGWGFQFLIFARMDIDSRIFQQLAAYCDPDWLAQTRVRPLRGFGGEHTDVWVKREDESGFGISGTKRFKFASLIPYLRKKGKPAVLIGGSNSNHVVSAIQAFRENSIPFVLYLKRPHSKGKSPGGNAFLLSLLADESDIVWVESADWPEVESIASRELPDYEIIPEGGFHLASVPGACMLYREILRNERSLGIRFQHIFMDAGTGLSAGAIAAMLALSGRETTLQVMLAAGDQAFFEKQYRKVSYWLGHFLECDPISAPKWQFAVPPTARSFGSVNATILGYVKQFARQYGILTDPIYTAKLFLTAEQIVGKDVATDTCLIIHSGGGTGLMGFAEKFT